MHEVIDRFLQNKKAVAGAAGVVGLSAGFAIGFIAGRKKGSQDVFDAIFEAEWLSTLEDAEECPDFVEPVDEGGPEDDPFEDPEDEEADEPSKDDDISERAPGFVSYNEIIERAKYHHSSKKAEEMTRTETPERVVHNIFKDTAAPAQASPEWDYDAEDEYRAQHPDGPYPIHVDEFTRNDLGYRQETLTYYAQDDILAQQDDTPVYNYAKLTGELKFGYGSNDPGVVYIRNAGIRTEWEILHHDASFAEEVHGLSVEEEYEEQDLKHSADRKFRLEG